MQREQPSVVVLAGPNGAGKSTMASQLLVDVLGVSEFVDADVLARGLPRSEAAAVTAGRLMLRRLDALAEGRRSFGFETTSPGIPLVAKRRLCSGEGGRSSTYRSPRTLRDCEAHGTEQAPARPRGRHRACAEAPGTRCIGSPRDTPGGAAPRGTARVQHCRRGRSGKSSEAGSFEPGKLLGVRRLLAQGLPRPAEVLKRRGHARCR